MNDTDSLDPSSITTPPSRASAASRTGVSRTGVSRRASRPRTISNLAPLKPRASKYSLRLGDVERKEGERVAREKGISLADFIRFAFHDAIQRHKEARGIAGELSTSEDEL